jgi:hypothetical protein
MSWDKFVWWERTYRLRSQDKRETPIIGKENCVLKLETTYTSNYYLWEVYDVSRYEAMLAPRFIGPFETMEESEEELKAEFSKKILIRPNLEGEIHFKGGRFVTPQNSKFWNVTKIH